MNTGYVDTAAIVQIIGCVFNDATILDNTDKYSIHEEDFTEDFHKIVFGSIYNIHLTGSNVTLDAIIDYLENRPKFNAVFKANKGEEYLLEASQIAHKDTFNYYYNRLKKFTLLRAYESYGVDVKELYDPYDILNSKKKQEQENWLDNVSISDIVRQVDNRIDEIKNRYAEDDIGVGYQAGDGVLELVDNLKAHPEVGIPLYGPLINTVTRGARLRKFYLRSAATGTGKAIPNDTFIPTPNGKKRVGDIKVGDYLFGQDGKPTKVLAIHPQPEKKDIWRVTFADGRTAECCGEHLWEYRYESHRGFAYRVENTQTIYERTLKLKNGFKDASNKGFRFYIKMNEAVEYSEKDLPLSPYVMGAFLGDGSFRYSNSNKSLQFSSKDDVIPRLIVEELGKNYYYTKNSDFNFTYCFRSKEQMNHPIWVEEFLSNYSELWNVKSKDKFIPEDYLTGSIEQRLSLLQGLLDTDGSISNKGGKVSFTTISPKLRDNVIELCQSLGFVATYGVDLRPEKYTTGECYNVHIQCKKGLKQNLFRLPSKKKRAQEYANTTKREEYKNHLAIVNIKKIEEQTDMTCFTVDNDSHLFLMNDYIVTHNTRSMIADACNFACDKIYHEQFGWIKNGAAQPTLYIATEQDKSEVQTMMLAFLSSVNEEHILNGQYVEGEEERVREAANILTRSPLWIEELPDFSLQDVENVMKKYIREHDVKYMLSVNEGLCNTFPVCCWGLV